MDLLTKLVLALHLLGMAAVVGGWLVARRGSSFPVTVLWGARAQLVTGLALVGLAEASKEPGQALSYAKITVKLLVALAVVAMAEIGAARARRGQPHGTQLDVAGGGAVVNVLVAALW